jgi:hypothetical protein
MLPRLELIENPDGKNDFIIFRHQIGSKKMAGFSKKRKLTSKSRRYHKKSKTKTHKKRKSIFNIF